MLHLLAQKVLQNQNPTPLASSMREGFPGGPAFLDVLGYSSRSLPGTPHPAAGQSTSGHRFLLFSKFLRQPIWNDCLPPLTRTAQAHVVLHRTASEPASLCPKCLSFTASLLPEIFFLTLCFFALMVLKYFLLLSCDRGLAMQSVFLRRSGMEDSLLKESRVAGISTWSTHQGGSSLEIESTSAFRELRLPH